jgi:hypothetical protein
MRGFGTASICLLVSLALGSRPMAQTPEKPATRVIELTPKMNGDEVKVHIGDELALKLPIQAPFDWGLTAENPALKEFRAPLKLVPIKQTAQGNPAVGKPQTSRLRYTVLAVPKTPKVEWVYCVQGQAIVDGKAIKPTDPLKPDVLPTKSGTFFRVKLVPQD